MKMYFGLAAFIKQMWSVISS